jgi:hypothetical protein
MKYSDDYWYENGYWVLMNNDVSGRFPATTNTTPKWRRMIEVLFKKSVKDNGDGTVTHSCITEEMIDEYINAASTK